MSREKKYTLGPWYVKENTEIINDYDVCDQDGYLILLGGTSSTDERQLADVTLAAAAPKLLEALEELHYHCTTGNGVDPVAFNKAIQDAERAIAKAYGEEAAEK